MASLEVASASWCLGDESVEGTVPSLSCPVDASCCSVAAPNYGQGALE